MADFNKDAVDKQLNIQYSGGTISNSDTVMDTFELTESICSGDQIQFGLCEASSVTFRVNYDISGLHGQKLIITRLVEGETVENNVGIYKVDSDVPTDDRYYRDITAYDSMYDILNTDVSVWYNTILPDTDSTVTLKQFRYSFFEYFGIEQEAVDLVNDSIKLSKTIEPSQLSGKTVITAICEINGCFGHISPEGKFRYVFLEPIAADMANNIDVVISAKYEDYQTERITKLQIRQEENDIGYIYGAGDNCYIVQDNFLVYGKSSEELSVIAKNLYSVICNVAYTPAHIEAKGNPNLSVGDSIKVVTRNKTIYTYILQRTLKGIQALRDTYDADGEQYLSEKVDSVHEQIIQLKGKTNVLKRTIEELSVTITDKEQGLSSRIEQNASGISTEVKRAKEAENALDTKIEQTDTKISLEVSKLQKEIDGEIKTYNVDHVPTLDNYPAWDWTTIYCNDTVYCNDVPMTYSDEEYSKNARTIAFDETTFISYRFMKDSESGKWFWREIADSEYSYVLQQLAELKIEADNISSTVQENKTYSDGQFENLSSKITQTANSITSEVKRATSAEGELSSKITQTAEKITSEITRATQAEGTLSSRITQTASSLTSEITRATQAEGTLHSIINQQATEISAKVSQQGGNASSFAWVLNASGFELVSGNRTVFKCNSGGISIDGYTTTNELNAVSGRVGSLEADHVSVSSLNAVSARVGNLEADHVSVGSFNALNATVAGKLTTSELQSKIASLSYVAVQGLWYAGNHIIPIRATIGGRMRTVLVYDEE